MRTGSLWSKGHLSWKLLGKDGSNNCNNSRRQLQLQQQPPQQLQQPPQQLQQHNIFKEEVVLDKGIFDRVMELQLNMTILL
jgi:hypothetical protein